MTEEVKIYAYKLSITEGNIKVEEIEFNAIEKQKTYILKQDGDNTTKRVVYELFEDALFIYYSEPSLEKAMSSFKKVLGNRIVSLGTKIDELTIKKQACEKFVADMKGEEV